MAVCQFVNVRMAVAPLKVKKRKFVEDDFDESTTSNSSWSPSRISSSSLITSRVPVFSSTPCVISRGNHTAFHLFDSVIDKRRKGSLSPRDCKRAKVKYSSGEGENEEPRFHYHQQTKCSSLNQEPRRISPEVPSTNLSDLEEDIDCLLGEVEFMDLTGAMDGLDLQQQQQEVLTAPLPPAPPSRPNLPQVIISAPTPPPVPSNSTNVSLPAIIVMDPDGEICEDAPNTAPPSAGLKAEAAREKQARAAIGSSSGGGGGIPRTPRGGVPLAKFWEHRGGQERLALPMGVVVEWNGPKTQGREGGKVRELDGDGGDDM